MKNSLLFLIACLTLFSYSAVKAATVTENETKLRDDVIYILLYPFIQQELYGEIKQNECAKIIKIERLPVGTYLFNVTVQVGTFEDAHDPPYDLVTIAYSNEKEWHVIDFNRKRLKPDEILWCD